MDCHEHTVDPAAWHETWAGLVSSGARMVDFLTAVDDPQAGRIEVVAHLVDPDRAVRHLLSTRLDRAAPLVDSVVDLSPGAAWHERETHELFGVDFVGNPDLSPLLTDGSTGWPLRRTTALPRRVATPWPGAVDPADRPAAATRSSGRVAARPRVAPTAPGVHPQWQP